MSDQDIIKGCWHDIRIAPNLEIIEASYDRIKDFRIDPKGYFLIRIDEETNNIEAGFCTFPENVMEVRIIGKTALEIINTIIGRSLVSNPQHIGDLGIELYKAELALQLKREYKQDQELILGPRETNLG